MHKQGVGTRTVVFGGSTPSSPLFSFFRQSKIRAALDKAAFLPSPLTGVPLTIVDTATLPDGGGPLALEVPVVAWRGSAGEARVPRTPPRATADKVAAALVAAKPGTESE